MKCPYCNEEAEFETYVLYNAEVYRKPVVGKTKCCGKGVRVSTRTVFQLSALSEYETLAEDDWGDKLS